MSNAHFSNRRRFLQGSLAGAAALAVSPRLWAQAPGANGDIRLGIIGIGEKASGRGSNHLKEFGEKKGCRIVGVCDADSAVLDIVKGRLKDPGVQYYQDYRKLLENKDIDAVVIATPNHTHTLISIAAMQAGKHVYVEKPVSHNLWEGRKLVEHAAKHPNLIVQHGMQRRSDHAWEEIMEFVKTGKIGKPVVSRGLCYKLRGSIGKVGAPVKPPATVDYSLWSGTRPELPVHRKRFHYDWHWQWEYGNGDIGNQGPHQLDVARWLAGDPQACPESVISIGGRFGYDDDATTANTQIAFYDFKPIPVIFEVRGLPDKDMNFRGRVSTFRGKAGGAINVFECEGGYIVESKAYDKDGKEVAKFNKNDGAKHQDRFLEAIRAGKIADTHNALTGHLSAGLAHMANHSYRCGADTGIDAIKAKIGNNALFAETFDRMLTHLTDNKIDLGGVKPVLGASLTFDPVKELYTGENADAANKFNREEYSTAFPIPNA
ncbi:MAG: Gfo/Idh/MocA family oxidoreductase [Verrucomicrobiota bacterium]